MKKIHRSVSAADMGFFWTGQKNCYDVNGREVNCEQSGQDAEFHNGIQLLSNRFEVNDQIVLDKLTGLNWLLDANPAEFPLSWQEALDYATDMNERNFLGYADWRMPNRRELRSLIDLQEKKPALAKDHPFINIFQSWYWTSTTAVISPAHAWYINMEGARMFYGGKDQSYFLWPVRGNNHNIVTTTGQKNCFDEKGQRISCAGSGQDGEYQYGKKYPQSRMTQSRDYILDHMTNLQWLQNANLTQKPVSWPQALHAICLLNKQDSSKKWRLPNINELESLVDCAQANPALPVNHLFNDIQDTYWSSTTSMYESDWAWALYLEKGAIGVGQKSGPYFYVWPVSNTD